MMVVNSSGDNSESSGTRSMLASKALSHRRRRSKGTIAGFASGKTGDAPTSGNSSAAPVDSGDGTGAPESSGPNSGNPNSSASSQPQHQNDSSSAPTKPCHSARLALMCSQNAIRMGARTQLGLCPPGRARRGLKAALKQKNKTARRSRSITSLAPSDTGGYFGVDKMLGPEVMENYPAQEETFLVTTNTFDEESDEEASSGDDDDLNDLDLLTSEEAPALDDDGKYKNLNEPLFTPIGAENALANNPGVTMSGPMGSGKLPFNRRKLRYFDSISATDRTAARAYLNTEIKRSKQREVAMLSKHLRQIQRRERRRIKEEKGLPLAKADMSDDEDSVKGKSGIPTQVSQFGHTVLPATAAALLIESLSLNPLESIDGIAKCYDGIVAAGVALLEANVNDPTSPTSDNERRIRTRSEIMAALTPVLITSLEQPSGDVILSLARLRRMCGTVRYQRRFVQRVGPSLIRPPNAAIWCLKHQNDMEPILAAAELIFDSASEIFSKGWRDRGELLLADSKRAETLQTAAMQLRSLRPGPAENFVLGNSLTGHGGWRTTRVHKDGAKGSNESLAEWEVIAVDRQIRVSISNIISTDWTLVNVQSRDLELSRTYHRTRSLSKRPSVMPSASADNSPKLSSTAPISPARPSLSKAPSSPRARTPPPGDKLDPVEKLPETSTKPDPSESRAKSPIPPVPPPPAQPSPISPPTPHRASSEDIESRIPTDTASSQSVPVAPLPSSAPPRSPTPKSPMRPETLLADIPMMPAAKAASSPLSPTRRSLTNVKQSIAGPKAASPVPSHEKQLAPLSPSSVGTGVSHDNMPARFMSSASSVSSGMTGTMGTPPAHYRTLTSTAAERKRTVAACRALRAQITRFEDAFIQLHGRPPKGAAERAPLATTYAQYREWKRAIRADAACRIQAFLRGGRVRLMLLRRNDPRVDRIIKARAGRQDSIIGSRRPQAVTQESVLKKLSIPAEIGEPSSSPDIVQAPGVGAIGPDGFPTLGPAGQTLPPQWGNQIVRRRSGSTDGFSSSSSPAPRPTSSPSSGASVSSSGSAEFSRQSLPELQARKRELKQQLKQYDMNFARRHGRMPVKAEKEPIRHLYERYNALKSHIGSMEHETPRGVSAASSSASQASSGLPQRTVSPVSIADSSGDESPARRSRASRAPPGGSSSVSSGPSSQDLAGLKAEKGRLHQMLRSFEKDFFREHQRQVSSFADIRPVAGQYRRYKEIKKAIAALQHSGER